MMTARVNAGLALLLVLLAPPLATQPATPSALFHHFHFRVGDPAAAMNHAASALNGTRVLLRGVGVGARVGSVYAMFDRLDAAEAPARRSPEDAYVAAVSWLRSQGIAVQSDGRNDASRSALAEIFRSELVDHVGFTTPDLPAAVSTLRSRGVSLLRESADAVLFQAAGDLRVEVLRDVEAPDAFWCPMHPDVRSATPGKCPICAMTLVPIPPARLGEYRMDVAIGAGRGGGISRLKISVREPDGDVRVTSFATVHERLLHLFVIDRTLQFFRHVHPDPMADGSFDLRENIPPGEYVVIADFLPQGGVSQMVQRAVVSPGYKGPLFPKPPDLSADVATERIVDGVRVQIHAEALKAGREGVLRFTLSDAVTHASITDLEPYLGAPGHVLIVSPDLTEADHLHPEEAVATGPSLTFRPLVAAGGFYKLWLQFQRKSVVTTVPFAVRAEER
jgi:catechol 2,3-dioxygenase-like lactoylglutathione lyase family enzyme